MSNPSLPQETLDYIVDLLHGEPEALKACCLVSKSWVSRTRKHLFVRVLFRSADDLEAWRATFPDPANSPASYSLALSVCSPAVPGADTEAGGLIRSFSHIESLHVAAEINLDNAEVSLAPFRGISPTLKSLRVYSFFLCPQVFDLVRSFPLLEDLALTGMNNSLDDDGGPHEPQTIIPSTSPPLTGCLDLITPSMGYAVRRLVDIPNGIHFRKLMLSWFLEEDFRWIMELILRCADTLESLDIGCSLQADSSPASIDLSKATKLGEVVFRPGSLSVAWITRVLQTIPSKHLDIRSISIRVPRDLTPVNAASDVGLAVGDGISDEWFNLDRLFVKLWESHKIRPRMVYAMLEEKDKQVKHRIECLLPEITKRGIIDPVEQSGPPRVS